MRNRHIGFNKGSVISYCICEKIAIDFNSRLSCATKSTFKCYLTNVINNGPFNIDLIFTCTINPIPRVSYKAVPTKNFTTILKEY
ncbi:hypothetical protein PMI17_01371 [Pantoea sp. GM01]|nr:hypothetical protein PMI17_01371 [Pantoea sp. GM01]